MNNGLHNKVNAIQKFDVDKIDKFCKNILDHIIFNSAIHVGCMQRGIQYVLHKLVKPGLKRRRVIFPGLIILLPW